MLLASPAPLTTFPIFGSSLLASVSPRVPSPYAPSPTFTAPSRIPVDRDLVLSYLQSLPSSELEALIDLVDVRGHDDYASPTACRRTCQHGHSDFSSPILCRLTCQHSHSAFASSALCRVSCAHSEWDIPFNNLVVHRYTDPNQTKEWQVGNQHLKWWSIGNQFQVFWAGNWHDVPMR